MARARASHEASAHAKRCPREAIPRAEQLHTLRARHWPDWVRRKERVLRFPCTSQQCSWLLFSLASAGNLTPALASAGFAPSLHTPGVDVAR